MGLLLKHQAESSHWYLPTGVPFYEVPRADGLGMRDATIADARKAGALRSVTNVLSVLAKPGLVNWQKTQCILAALTLPRPAGEDDQTFAQRVLADADAQSKAAREEGEKLHAMASAYLLDGTLPDKPYKSLLGPFAAWVEANVRAPILSETVVVNLGRYYAGRLDIGCILNDGTYALADIKTQDVKRDSKNIAKPAFYDEWPIQLAAYSRCKTPDGAYLGDHPWRLISLVVDRIAPGCYPKEWTDPQDPIGSSAGYFDAFVNLCHVWSHFKKCTPGMLKAA